MVDQPHFFRYSEPFGRTYSVFLQGAQRVNVISMKPKAAKKKPVRRGRRARSASKPKVRKPKKPLPLRKRVRHAVFPAVVLVSFSIYALCAVVDRRVKARLNSLQTPKLPVVLSSPFEFGGFVSRVSGSPPALRSTLAEHRYSEVNGGPTRPGEYSIRDGTIQIFTRSFQGQNGETISEKKETIELARRDTDEHKRVWLEPQVISYVGSADMRASSFVPLSSIPALVQHAVIAIEDERFYRHFGLDLMSIARAVTRNLMAMRLVQGGSTLTQQLAKNLFLSPRKTFVRKLMEIPTALSLERHMSKDQLLELYLNEVYLGQEGAVAIHGMPEAASTFFGKKLEDLRIDEAATLAGIIKAPSYFNPRRFPERARERRDLVIEKMQELGYISPAEATVAHKQVLRTVQQQEHRRIAPFYAAALESQLSEVLDIDNASSTGLTVYTGLDLGMQRCAENAVAVGLAEIEKSHPKLMKQGKNIEAALVAIEPYSGLVKAWVGGRDFSSSQFNRVSQGFRQVGSTIKPFLYLTALDGSLNSYKVATAASILEDKPIEVKTKGQDAWNPENYDHDFRGDVTVRYALENSLNMPALYIAERVGIAAVARTVSAFKLAPEVPKLPSLALGALDTNLVKLTAAYGALANGGVYIAPRMYVAAYDGDRDRLSAPKLVEERVADENATFVLTNLLQGVIERGTATSVRRAGFDRPAAGKTGTSDSARDAWFVGFTPNLAVGVWVGFDDNSELGLTGGGAAAPIWGKFMACGAPYVPEASFIAPSGVGFFPIDTRTGLLATDACPGSDVTREVFVLGTEPKSRCMHGGDQSVSSETPAKSEDPRGGGFWSRLLRR